MNTECRSVVFVVYPDFKFLDLAGPLQAFTDALNDAGKPIYKTTIASVSGGTIRSDTTTEISSEPLSDLARRRIDTLVVVGGRGVFEAMKDINLLTSIKKLELRSARVSSICSGAFVLAECGLLDGLRAVTHWEYCDKLADYPLVEVVPNAIFINDGNRWTSAGVTTGIDMAIAMISEDHGRATGLALAQSFVTYMVRPGGQSQFSKMLELQSEDSYGRFDKLHKWILNNLQKDLSIENLADYVSMSPRNFSRLYLAETGRTPAKAVEALRVEAARCMLVDKNLTLSVVAARCGFGEDERMRRSFMRHLKITPQSYRNRFG